MMKTLLHLIVPMIFVLVAQDNNFSQGLQRKHESPAGLRVEKVDIKKSNVPLVLSEIADEFNIPIGVEVSPDDDLLREGKFIIQMDSTTVGDMLNSLVKQNPLYTWEVVDDVINVFPKGSREPLLKELLETQIETFTVSPRTSRFSFRESLTGTAQVKGVLATFGVTPNNEIFLSRDIAPLGPDFSLSLSNTTVRFILNRVIRDSGTKYWIVNRNGTRKEYLLLNL